MAATLLLQRQVDQSDWCLSVSVYVCVDQLLESLELPLWPRLCLSLCVFHLLWVDVELSESGAYRVLKWQFHAIPIGKLGLITELRQTTNRMHYPKTRLKT
jgi:hypothetical protein